MGGTTSHLEVAGKALCCILMNTLLLLMFFVTPFVLVVEGLALEVIPLVDEAEGLLHKTAEAKSPILVLVLVLAPMIGLLLLTKGGRPLPMVTAHLIVPDSCHQHTDWLASLQLLLLLLISM